MLYPIIPKSYSDARSASQPLRVDPTSRGLQPGASRESLNGKQPKNNKLDPNPKDPPKAKKPATYTGKANSKLKVGRSCSTDAKFWVQKIQEDQALPEPTERKVTLGSRFFYNCNRSPVKS